MSHYIQKYLHFNIYGMDFLKLIFFILFGILLVLCIKIYRNMRKYRIENQELLESIQKRDSELDKVKKEAETNYIKFKERSGKLEEHNDKLQSSLAEFFNVQEIVRTIGSVFDINDLIRQINDIILGVMGVTNSTVAIYIESRERLKIHTTSVIDKKQLIELKDNINCSAILNTLESGQSILATEVCEEQYPFTKNRDCKSFICVPLIRKNKKYGLVLIEHNYEDAFNMENLRFLEIIGRQVEVTMENAWLYEKMKELATIDGLTGIYNRVYFQEKFKEELNNAKTENYDLSLVILDIDHFKNFNDKYGHLFGDEVLKHIVKIINRLLRKGDIFARFGGEEFIILFPRMSIEQAYTKVNQLKEEISKSKIHDGETVATVTASFGISSYTTKVFSETEMIRLADEALYLAKNSGRNCIKTYLDCM